MLKLETHRVFQFVFFFRKTSRFLVLFLENQSFFLFFFFGKKKVVFIFLFFVSLRGERGEVECSLFGAKERAREGECVVEAKIDGHQGHLPVFPHHCKACAFCYR